MNSIIKWIKNLEIILMWPKTCARSEEVSIQLKSVVQKKRDGLKYVDYQKDLGILTIGQSFLDQD